MSAPDGYEGSTRSILHLVPQDGTQHDMVECYCHPRIVEANAEAGVLGLEDVGVPDAERGELIFMHNAAGESHVTQMWWESDDEGSDQ